MYAKLIIKEEKPSGFKCKWEFRVNQSGMSFHTPRKVIGSIHAFSWKHFRGRISIWTILNQLEKGNYLPRFHKYFLFR